MKEEEIRPKEILQRYLDLSAKDGQKLDSSLFVETPCQACGKIGSSPHIKKQNFNFVKCSNCHSLYCSPRPSNDQLNSLYFNSESAQFWSNVFFPSVREARRQKLFAPKAEKISNLIRERSINIDSICDVGAGHGLFLEELKKQLPGSKLYAIEPDSTSAQACRSKGIETLEETSETAHLWREKFDFIICSEVIEHVFDVSAFINSLQTLLKPGGYCLVTGLGYEGFDILTMQDQSKSISPPHHLNFLSINGFETAFKKSNFSKVDIWTPGQLDVDIVLNSEIENEFVRVLKTRGDKVIQEFQQFLARNQLSSHTWILAQK
jgi:SAM-dependent methyltransferase